jgi:hypothetical protein
MKSVSADRREAAVEALRWCGRTEGRRHATAWSGFLTPRGSPHKAQCARGRKLNRAPSPRVGLAQVELLYEHRVSLAQSLDVVVDCLVAYRARPWRTYLDETRCLNLFSKVVKFPGLRSAIIDHLRDGVCHHADATRLASDGAPLDFLG